MLEPKKLLLYLSIKFKGEWNRIYSFITEKEEVDEEEAKSIISKVNCDYVTIIEKEYPECLKRIACAPFCLFLKGNRELLNWPSKRKIAVIGSRDSTDYGEECAENIVSGFNDEYLIISGLAKGIDGIAHSAALKNNLKTIAIIGSGFDKFYPKENNKLYKDIINNGGLIISEYYKDVEPSQNNFPKRNRIIAGLCDALVVVEAYEKSGTSITASYALSFGKDVCCVPCNAGQNSLCNQLIKDGAYLVENANDVMTVLN